LAAAARLTPVPDPPEGTIALLFTDIQGSTRLARALGTARPAVLADHHAIVGTAIAAERGFVDARRPRRCPSSFGHRTVRI
jgi:class 3 adenylate cyclase